MLWPWRLHADCEMLDASDFLDESVTGADATLVTTILARQKIGRDSQYEGWAAADGHVAGQPIRYSSLGTHLHMGTKSLFDNFASKAGF